MERDWPIMCSLGLPSLLPCRFKGSLLVGRDGGFECTLLLIHTCTSYVDLAIHCSQLELRPWFMPGFRSFRQHSPMVAV